MTHEIIETTCSSLHTAIQDRWVRFSYSLEIYAINCDYSTHNDLLFTRLIIGGMIVHLLILSCLFPFHRECSCTLFWSYWHWYLMSVIQTNQSLSKVRRLCAFWVFSISQLKPYLPIHIHNKIRIKLHITCFILKHDF